MRQLNRWVVGPAACLAAAFANAGYDDYQSGYLKNVVLPTCDPARADVQFIRSNSDWNHINDSDKSIFCVEPGNYQAAGIITITSSGTSNNPRVIRTTNTQNVPWQQQQVNRSSVKALEMRNADNWIVHGLVITNPEHDVFQAAIVEVENDSDGIIFDQVLIEDAPFRLLRISQGSDNITLQRSVVRNIHVPLLGTFEGMCVALQKNDAFGDTRNIHIVDNEIYGCGGDSIQMRANEKDNPLHGFRGIVIENNDLFVPESYRANCATGALDPSGACACSENAIDIKINFINDTPNQTDIARIIHNRMWGHRPTPEQGCGTAGDIIGAAIVIHHAEADYILIKENIILDAENGVWMAKAGPDHLSVIGNLFYDVANKTNPRAVLAIDTGSNFEAYNNAIIDSQRYLLTGGGSEIDVRNNLAINAGTWIPRSSTGDYSANEATIGNNYYYNTQEYNGSASIENDLVMPAAADAKTESFCFVRNLLTSPNQFCVPNVRSGSTSPHNGQDDMTAGSRLNIGVDDSIAVRTNIWDGESSGETVRPEPPTLN